MSEIYDLFMNTTASIEECVGEFRRGLSDLEKLAMESLVRACKDVAEEA
jgi:hypothetical protein